jgi:nicotinamidase-related amidase
MTLKLRRETCGLLIIDVQERLAGAMPEKVMAQLARNAEILIEAARRFEMPVVVTEQYPKGLGPTVEVVQKPLELLEAAHLHRFDKTEFCVCDAAGFEPVWNELYDTRRQWVVAGMETHICVYQTVRALAERGLQVHVVSDAVASRRESNWKIGMSLCERAGAVATSTEVVVMDLLGGAGGDDFKAISKMIR